MANATEWWDGESLGPGPVGFAVYPQAGTAQGGDNRPALGAACSANQIFRLLPYVLGAFLLHHPEANYVCHDAAALHWLIHDYLQEQNDSQALQVLWRLSAEGRLVDLQILDQHVRRFHGQDGSEGRSLAQLAQDYAQLVLPSDQEIQNRVAAAWAQQSQPPDEGIFDLVAMAASALLQVHRRLQEAAEQINTDVQDSNRAVEFDWPLPAEDPQITAQRARVLAEIKARRQADPNNRPPRSDSERAVLPAFDDSSPAPLGLLGIGLDVQGAIAAKQLGNAIRGFTGRDRQQRLLELGEQTYQEASAQLKCDHRARGCFKWSHDRVARDANGEPIGDPEKLRAWLQNLAGQMIDRHDWPTASTVPRTATGELSLDAEQWRLWADFDWGLGAWRRLGHAVAMLRLAREPNRRWPVYHSVLFLQCTPPPLRTLQNAVGPILQPRVGHVFLVGKLCELKIRCFAAVCRRSGYAYNGRLYGYLLGQAEPVETAASELYAHVMCRQPANARTGSAGQGQNADRGDDADQGRNDPSYANRFQAAVASFWDREQTPSAVREHWAKRTQAFLESLPFGMGPLRLRVYLEQVHGIELEEHEVETLSTVLRDQIAYEIDGYLDDDLLERIARHLRLPVRDVIKQLWPEEHPDTAYAGLRNDLFDRREGRPLWKLLSSAGYVDGGPEEIAQRILFRTTRSLGGRVTPRAYPLETRRWEYLFAVDEVLKAVVYALVAAGYRLVALAEEGFVLEVAESAVPEDQMERIGRLADQAARKFLGHLSPPCSVQVVPAW